MTQHWVGLQRRARSGFTPDSLLFTYVNLTTAMTIIKLVPIVNNYLYLNPAIAKFAEGVRLRTRRHTVVLQVYANRVDSVKSAVLKGGKHDKNLPYCNSYKKCDATHTPSTPCDTLALKIGLADQLNRKYRKRLLDSDLPC